MFVTHVFIYCNFLLFRMNFLSKLKPTVCYSVGMTTSHQKMIGIILLEKNLGILHSLLQETEELVLEAICFFPRKGFVKA